MEASMKRLVQVRRQVVADVFACLLVESRHD
jgi:hypothetical protein